ncbi:MAG: Glycosyl transferase family 2 [bacterium ADurb.Bin236]|nr:MAG: Glycosyl transferase family 2 [bacterium ADurb.Bin236]
MNAKTNNKPHKTKQKNSVAVLIPFINNRTLLSHCLSSLRATSDVAVHVCCDEPGRPKDVANICKKFAANLIYNEEWLGYCATTNRLASHAQEDFLVFCNCDIMVNDSWRDKLMRTWASANNPGFVSPKIISMQDRSLNYCGIAFGKANAVALWTRSLPHPEISSETNHFQAVPDCFALIKHETYETAGPRDSNFPVSWTDLDLCLKLKRLGFTNISDGSCEVLHFRHVSGEKRMILDSESRAYFFAKWRDTIDVDLPRWLIKSFSSARDRSRLRGKTVRLVIICPLFDRIFYIEAIQEAFEVQIGDMLEINTLDKHPSLFSLLTIEVLKTNSPIIYLFKNYESFYQNIVWFEQRKGKKDLIVDYYGNADFADSLFSRHRAII